MRNRRVSLQLNVNKWGCNKKLLSLVALWIQPVVIFLQEVKEVPSDFLCDYWLAAVRLGEPGDGGGSRGGVAILIHKSISKCDVKERILNEEERKDIGAFVDVVALDISDRKGINKTMSIINVYCAPQSTGPHLNHLLNAIQNDGNLIHLCGDFNATHDLWSNSNTDFKVRRSDPRRKRGNNIAVAVMSAGLAPLNTAPTTKWDSTLDLSFSSSELVVEGGHRVLTEYPWKGGHFPLVTVFEQQFEQPGRKMTNIYRGLKSKEGPVMEANYAAAVDAALKEAGLDAYGLQENREDPGLLLNSLTIAMKEASVGIFPRVNIRSPFFEKKREEWITEELLSDGMDREEMEERSNAWFQGKCNEASLKTNPKQVWDLLHLRDNRKCRIYHGEKSAGEFVNDLGWEFSFGCEKDNETVQLMKQIQVNERRRAMKIKGGESPFIEVELSLVLGEIDSDKSGGADSLDSPQVKALRGAPLARKLLLQVANRCLETGTHPDVYKLAIVSPQLKPSGDYRPISLLSVIDKCIQGLFIGRLAPLVFPQICGGQYGFLPGHSPEMALAALHERCVRARARSKSVGMLCVDFRGAFDRVRGKHAVDALRQRFGVPRQYWSWVSDFLTGRQLQVVCDEWGGRTYSDRHDAELGVVQGSRLGPLLWAVHVDSLLWELENEFGKGVGATFADDINLVLEGRDDKELENQAQRACKIIQNWADRKGQPLREDKSKFMVVNKQQHDPYMEINGTKLEVAKEVKVLGVIWDGDLTFVQHVKDLTKKVSNRTKALFALGGQRWGVSEHSLKTLYKNYIEAVVRYASPIWFPFCPARDVSKLQAQLNIGMRYCNGYLRGTNNEIIWDAMGDMGGKLEDVAYVAGVTLVEKVIKIPHSNVHEYLADATTRSFGKKSILGHYWDRFLQLVPDGVDAIPPSHTVSPTLRSWTSLHNVKFNTDVTIRSEHELQLAAQDKDYVLSSDAGVELSESGAAGTGSLIARPLSGATDSWDIVWEEGKPCGTGHSSYTAEICAAIHTMKKALEILVIKVNMSRSQLDSKSESILLITDSLSALTHLSHFRPCSALDEEFFEVLNELSMIADVTLRHVKSHIGTSLSERADGLASAGLREQIDKGEIAEIVGKNYVKDLAKALARETRQEFLEQLARSPSSKCRWHLHSSRDSKGKT